MNNLNSFSVDAGAETAIVGVEREGEAKTDTFEAGRAEAGILALGIALGLTDGGVVAFSSEGAELLEREDLWEPLADLIGPAAARLLATF